MTSWWPFSRPWDALWFLRGTPAPAPVVAGTSIFPPNVSLIFRVPVALGENSHGRPQAETEPLIVLAYLKLSNYRQQETIEGGVAGSLLKGRMANPTAMPVAVQAGQVAEALFWRVVPGGFGLPGGFAGAEAYDAFIAANQAAVVVAGEFTWEANLPGSLGVEGVLGDKIQGQFVARSSWAD